MFEPPTHFFVFFARFSAEVINLHGFKELNNLPQVSGWTSPENKKNALRQPWPLLKSLFFPPKKTFHSISRNSLTHQRWKTSVPSCDPNGFKSVSVTFFFIIIPGLRRKLPLTEMETNIEGTTMIKTWWFSSDRHVCFPRHGKVNKSLSFHQLVFYLCT